MSAMTTADQDVRAEALEELLTSSMGVKGLMNKAKNKAIIKSYRYAKGKFGFDHNISSESQFSRICEYFENFSNVKILPQSKNKHVKQLAEIAKLFKVEKATFCYIAWNSHEKQGYMYIFGKKSYRHYNRIMNDIVNFKASSKNGTTVLYSIYAHSKDDWSGVRRVNDARSFDTLYLDNDIEHKIKSHIDNWLANKDTYKTRGITFKTGILLYGSPGTGKSSIAAAVAHYLNCDVISIDSATFKDLNLNEVTAAINADERMYVVLLDDIDVILTSREDTKATTDDKATIAKLLGFLDSSNSPDNVVFIATTNHIDLFDNAITRAGRFDKVIEVENISQETAYKMCKGFELSDKDTTEVLANQKDSRWCGINPASLQADIISKIRYNINNA